VQPPAPKGDPPAGSLGPVSDVIAELSGTDALADRFRRLCAHDFVGYCPIYERVALALADDERSLELLTGVAPVGRTPVLCLAAVHDLVLADPGSHLAAIYDGRSSDDPWPPFRELLHSSSDAVLDRMRTRTIQTNEVGRSAALAPSLTWVQQRAVRAGDDRPLAVVEVGPSAGLNLIFDRYALEYRREGRTVATGGDPSSPVRIGCELIGPTTPRLEPAPAVVVRTGIDVAPVDVGDEAARRWLAACLWPGMTERAQRLAGAIDLARTDPPHLVTGDAAQGIRGLLEQLPAEVLPVVVATWALTYLGRPGRELLLDELDAVARHRDLVLLSAEDPHVTPWIPPLPEAVATVADRQEGTQTVIGARTWRGGRARDDVLGVAHPHVRWLAWADDEGAA